LPHREPFKASLARYESLQQEWNYFLLSNQPEIDDDVLRNWGEQADRLRLQLEKLNSEPSGRNFFSARLALNSIRRKFSPWMTQTEDINNYQAQAWQSRLDALDRLLSYGERKSFKRY
ncbi:MAG: hypothetical protein AAFN00_15925, partial [Cyanobacteria bacterium J06558_2]